MWWILLVQLAYVFPLIITYILMFFIMIKKRFAYSSSFFTLFLCAAPANMIIVLNSYISIRIPAQVCVNCTLSYLYTDVFVPPISSTFFFLTFQFFFTYQALMFLIAMNRLSAILQPIHYEIVWSHLAMPLSLASYALPIIVTYPFVENYSEFEYVASIDAYIIRLRNTEIHPIFSILIRFILMTTALTLVINLLSVYLFVKKKSRNRAENALLFTSFAYFAMQISVAVMTSAFAFASRDSQRRSWISQFAMTGYPYVNDIATLTSPVLLLTFSKQLRTDLLDLVLCRGDSRVHLARQASRRSMHTSVTTDKLVAAV